MSLYNRVTALYVPETSIHVQDKKGLAQYRDGVCIDASADKISKGACRSRTNGNSVPQGLAVAYSATT